LPSFSRWAAKLLDSAFRLVEQILDIVDVFRKDRPPFAQQFLLIDQGQPGSRAATKSPVRRLPLSSSAPPATSVAADTIRSQLIDSPCGGGLDFGALMSALKSFGNLESGRTTISSPPVPDHGYTQARDHVMSIA